MVTTDASPDLTILIPAYNEEDVIEATTESVVAHFRKTEIDFEILIVNNNSTDFTEEVLRLLSELHGEVRWIQSAPRPGYGVAVRSGLADFRGDTVAIVMADGSESPEDIERLYRLIQDGADCGFGTRFADGARTQGYPGLKLVLNRLGNRAISFATGFAYDDFTNGFKAYRRWVIDAMQPLRGEEFELTVEMSVKAVNAGAKIAIAPNRWKERDDGVSKFKVLRQCRRYLAALAASLLQSDSTASTFLRFLAVGSSSSVTYLAVLTILVEALDASIMLAATFSYIVGAIVSYLGSALFAFRKPLSGSGLAKFLVVIVAAFILNIVLTYILDAAGLHYLLIGMVIVVTASVFNFFSHRFWTFRTT